MFWMSTNRRPRIVLVMLGAAMLLTSGCQSTRTNGARRSPGDWRNQGVIRRVRCIFDRDPWLNLDRAGDRDYEGFRYRVFLDAGQGLGVLREGTFHVELYLIDRDENGDVTRTLASDWHYSTSDFHTIAEPGMLGEGYFVHLAWGKKDIVGHQIEVITLFEDPDGKIARSGTKGLRVPKYSS